MGAILTQTSEVAVTKDPFSLITFFPPCPLSLGALSRSSTALENLLQELNVSVGMCHMFLPVRTHWQSSSSACSIPGAMAGPCAVCFEEETLDLFPVYSAQVCRCSCV